jgi:hypothetical protein
MIKEAIFGYNLLDLLCSITKPEPFKVILPNPTLLSQPVGIIPYKGKHWSVILRPRGEE